MNFIGNILTDNKVDVSELYNVVKSEKDLINDIPTLIIGYKKAISLYPNFNLLDFRIDNNVYWTFGRRERGEAYKKNIEKFKEITISNTLKKVKYTLFNVLTETEERKRELFSYINSSIEKIFYIENDMVFISSKGSNEVIGISLSDIEYEGNDKAKFLAKIAKNANNVILKNRENISYEIKSTFSNMPYIIPYIKLN